jgi:RHS repeat-associated protein
VFWLLTDHLGTVKDIVNNSGLIVNHIVYDAYGNLVSQTNSMVSSRYLFTGREFDAETGLYFYRARYYDAALGRFLSEDPIGMDSGDVNFYRYLANNPVDSTDPTGLQEAASEFGAQVVKKVAPKALKSFDEAKRVKDLKKIDTGSKAAKECELLVKDAEKTGKEIEKGFVDKLIDKLWGTSNDALAGE